MEDLLIMWIQHIVRKKIPLSEVAIREQALTLYTYVVEKYGSNANETFCASTRWFHWFKQRFFSHYLSFTGESASDNHAAAQGFPEEVRQLIAEKGSLAGTRTSHC
ncbi:hypothetical protein TKK_0007795 [Trichogramma kaykai]